MNGKLENVPKHAAVGHESIIGRRKRKKQMAESVKEMQHLKMCATLKPVLVSI